MRVPHDAPLAESGHLSLSRHRVSPTASQSRCKIAISGNAENALVSQFESPMARYRWNVHHKRRFSAAAKIGDP